MKNQTVKVYRDQAFSPIYFGLVVFCAIYFSGCGGKTSATDNDTALSCQTLSGHYVQTLAPSETLDITGCNLVDSYCGYTATYTIPTANPGTTVLTVIGTNGTPGCLSSTAHTCNVAWDSFDLAIDCGGGSTTFHRQ